MVDTNHDEVQNSNVADNIRIIQNMLDEFTHKVERLYHDEIKDPLHADTIIDIEEESLLNLRSTISELFYNPVHRASFTKYIGELARARLFPEMQNFALGLLRDNVHVLQDDIEHNSRVSKYEVFEALYAFASNGSYQDTVRVAEVFVNELPQLVAGFSEESVAVNGMDSYYDFFEYLLDRGSSEQASVTYRTIAEFLYDDEFDIEKRAFFVSKLYHSTKPTAHAIGKHFVHELLKCPVPVSLNSQIR